MDVVEQECTDDTLADNRTVSSDEKQKSEVTGTHLCEAVNQSDATSQSEEISLSEADERYGIGSWQPRSLQFMASPASFVTILCFFIICDAFFSGIQIALLTTFEKRYSLSAYQIGMIITINKIGTLFGLPVVSYLGGRPNNHRPRWIAGGAFVMAVGMIATCIPQFILGPYQYQHSHPEDVPSQNILSESFQLCNTTLNSSSSPDTNCKGNTSTSDNAAAYVIILISQFVAGLGFSPAKPLGISYIDDNVKSNKAGFYIGIMSSMYGVGAVIGFLAASATSLIWVDFYRTETTLDHNNPVFVSAWWLLFVFLTVILILSGIPFLGFPKRLPKKWRDDKVNLSLDERISQTAAVSDDSDNSDSKELWKTLQHVQIKEVFHSLYRLCTNSSYMLASFAFVTSGLVSGLFSFFPKYMETQFGLTTSFVNILVAIIIPALGLGNLVGGYLCRRWNPSVIGLTKMCLVCATVAALTQLLVFAFGCPNQQIAGINVDYMGERERLPNLTSSCNEGCHCTDDVFQPVCWEVNHITYISPCLAGCTAMLESKTSDTTELINCTCPHYNQSSPNTVSDMDFNNADSFIVSEGACAYQCLTLVPFLITIIVSIFIISVGTAPLVLTVVRSVDTRDKTFAYGIAKSLQYVIGVIPTPVITGALIDTTCKLWQFECGVRGACWVHDLPGFRSIIAGSGSVVIALQALLLVLCWYFLRRRHIPYKNVGQ